MQQKAYWKILLLASIFVLTCSSLQGCTIAGLNGVCYACQNRYYLSGGQCYFVNPLCNTYKPTTGSCLSCFAGYILNNQLCIKDTPIDPYCAKYSGAVCLSCISGYIFNANKKCQNTCATFNALNGYCNTCIAGYTLSNGKCLLSGGGSNPGSNNYACSQFVSGVCINCYPGYYINNLNICVIVNQLCKTYDVNTGLCFSCYQGYYVSSGLCLIVNPLCLTFDSNTGICLTCYPSYSLVNSQCVQTNPDCSSFTNGVCTNCYNGYYLSQGICVVLINPCKTYDVSTGNCLSCYQGYQLTGVNCIIP